MPQHPVIAALQVNLESLREDFEGTLLNYARLAMQEEAHLILWPEWVCLGLIPPGVKDPLKKAMETAGLAERHRKIFASVCSRIGIAAVAGTVPVKIRGKSHLVSYVFNRGGEEVLAQQKWHLEPFENALGILPGAGLEAVKDLPSPGHTLGVLMGRDARVPEMARLLTLKGADFLAEGKLDPRPYNSIERMDDIQMRVQENKIMGARSVLLGNVSGMACRGNAQVSAVTFATHYRDGVVAQAATNNEEELVIGEPDAAAVRDARKAFDLIENINADYVANHFPFKAPGFVELRPPVTVSAVQMGLEFSTTPKHFHRRVARYVEKAKAAGASLAVFPEDTGTCLLGLYLDLAGLIQSYREHHADPMALFKGEASIVGKVFQGVSPYALEVYYETFSSLAREYRIHLMAGSILIAEGKDIYNVAHLFDRSGNLVLTQKKMQLFSLEREWGLKTGKDTEVVELADVGRVGVMVCMDTGYPEEGRILTTQGAEILLDCTANPDECHTLENLNGLWARVQDNCLFGIKSCLYGSLPGLNIRGRSGIYAPCPITGDRTGILGEAAFSDADALVTATLDFKALRAEQERVAATGPVRFKELSAALSPYYKRKGKDGVAGKS